MAGRESLCPERIFEAGRFRCGWSLFIFGRPGLAGAKHRCPRICRGFKDPVPATPAMHSAGGEGWA
jgi:hypothetical protein